MPSGITVKVDGKTVAEASSFAWDDRKTLELKFPSVCGRKVVVVLEFPTGKGGLLDEVEIYRHAVK